MESNEVPSRQQAPPADDDRRQSQGSDHETVPPGLCISKFVLNSTIMKFHSYFFFHICFVNNYFYIYCKLVLFLINKIQLK